MKNNLKNIESLLKVHHSRYVHPDHFDAASLVTIDKKTLKSFAKVVDGIYRKTKPDIKPSPAAPLNNDEKRASLVGLFKRNPTKLDGGTVSGEVEKGIEILLMRACAGDGKALWELARLTSSAVRGLNAIAQTNPDAIKPFASLTPYWPMLVSTAPLLGTEKSLLAKIGLGTSTAIQTDKYSKWKPDEAARVAISLIQYLDAIRLKVNSLAKFNKDTAEDLWAIAEKVLLATYPKPEEIEELDALVTAKSKRKYSSTRRVAILEKIHARFLHLATYPS